MLGYRRIHIIVVAIGIIFSLPVNADLNADLNTCDTITPRNTRDKCFHKLQDRLSVASHSASTNTAMKWRVNNESSRSKDSSNVIISNDADASIFGRPARANTASLVLRCEKGKTAVHIVTGMAPQNYVYGPDGGVVSIQFDKERRMRHHVLQSIDENAIVLERSAELINRLIQHNTMFLSFSPFNSSPAMATFDLRGLAEVMKPLKDACPNIALQGTRRDKAASRR